MDEPPIASVSKTNPFPENELPKWLLRKGWDGIRGVYRSGRGIPYGKLSEFSFNLRTCAQSSADIVRGLELCLKPMRGSTLGDRWSGATDALRRGKSFADALSPGEDLLPPFFLPVIRAGEESGRLVDALQFLETHCKLLAGPASALRNVWLLPLAVFFAGSILKFVLVLAMGSGGLAMSGLWQETISWAQLAFFVAIATLTPAKYFIDQARLALPLLGPLEREIAAHRFFRVMSLMYEVGGHRVEQMIETSAKTVSNNAARLDYLRAARAIEEKESIPGAFRRVVILTQNQQASIETGDLSGKLESVFEFISEDTGASMISKLKLIQLIATRIAMAFVMLSIFSTLMSLAFAM